MKCRVKCHALQAKSIQNHDFVREKKMRMRKSNGSNSRLNV